MGEHCVDPMFFRYLIRRLAMWSSLLMVGVGVWLAVHASSEGLARSWKEAVRVAFERKGVPISIGKLTLDPIHGLVARDVRLYQRDADGTGTSQQVLADISRVDLDVSVAKLLRRQVVVHSVRVRDASASVPVDPANPDGDRLEISEFHSRVQFSPDSIELQELRGKVFGLLVSVGGELVRRPPPVGPDGAPKPAPTLPKFTREQRLAIGRALQTLGKLRVPPRDPAVLEVRAMADLGRMEEGLFEFSLRASQLAWDGLQVRDVVLRGEYDNGLLQAQDIRFQDAGGHFQAEAEFMRRTRTLRFMVDSHVLLAEELRRRFWPAAWPALEIRNAPALAIGGTLVFPEKSLTPNGLVSGSLALGKITADQTKVDYLSTNLSYDGRRLFLRDLQLRAGAGTLQADALLDGSKVQTHGLSTIHPETIGPFVPPGYGRNLVNAFDCADATKTSLAFVLKADLTDLKSLALDTRIDAAGIRFHGIPVAAARGAWQILPGGSHRFSDAFFTIPAGAPTGVGRARTTAVTTATAQEVFLDTPPYGPTRFRDLKCTGWPHAVVASVVPETLPAIPPFVLDAPASIQVDGSLGGTRPAYTDLKISLATDGMTRYPVLGKVLPLEGVRATVLLKERSAILPAVKADCYGGKVSGSLRFDGIGGRTVASSGKLNLEQVRYHDLTRLFKDGTEEIKGVVDIVGEFSIRDGTFATMDARGSMRMVDGDLFSIPLFGPLSPLVETVLPERGLGYSVASSATATCVVEDGILTTGDFTALTPAFRMDGRGTINLATTGVDFHARFNARGIAQAATVVLSYIFEYQCAGTLGEPIWKPTYIPKVPLPKLQLPKIKLPKLQLPKLPLPGRKAR